MVRGETQIKKSDIADSRGGRGVQKIKSDLTMGGGRVLKF